MSQICTIKFNRIWFSANLDSIKCFYTTTKIAIIFAHKIVVGIHADITLALQFVLLLFTNALLFAAFLHAVFINVPNFVIAIIAYALNVVWDMFVPSFVAFRPVKYIFRDVRGLVVGVLIANAIYVRIQESVSH